MRVVAIDWIGGIPSHWELKPLKAVCNFVNGHAFKPAEWADEGVPIIRIENLNDGETFNCFLGTVPEKCHVRQGNLLFGWSGNRGTSFGPFVWGRPGLHYLNQHIFRVTDFACDPHWLYWVLKGVTRRVETEAHGIIGMVHITQTKLGRVFIPVPPFDEQRAIAAFLDRETAKIDELIAIKRKLVRLLLERRSAEISSAVTGGLDLVRPTNCSGIPFISQIPSGWSLQPIKHLGSIFYGLGEPPDHDDDGIAFIRATDIHEGKIIAERIQRVSRSAVPWQRAVVLRKGDILVVRSGAYTGDSSIVPEEWEGAIAGYDMVLRVHKADSRFVAWALLSRYLRAAQLELASTRAAQPHLNAQELGNAVILLPPISEQAKIAEHVSQSTQKIDAMRDVICIAIDRLAEWRSSVISAAVTGQIDVRHYREEALCP